MIDQEKPPAAGAVIQPPPKEYQPLGKRAAAAIVAALAFTTCIAVNTWQNITVLAQGAPHTLQTSWGWTSSTGSPSHSPPGP